MLLKYTKKEKKIGRYSRETDDLRYQRLFFTRQ